MIYNGSNFLNFKKRILFNKKVKREIKRDSKWGLLKQMSSQVFNLRVENYNLKHSQEIDSENKEYIMVSMPGRSYKIYNGSLPISFIKNLKLVCWSDEAIFKLSEYLPFPSQWVNNIKINLETGVFSN